MFQNLRRSSQLIRGLVMSQPFKPTKRCYGIYEPDYLHLLRPSVPVYGPLNIQITGYDFAVLENYQKLVHEICTTMNINVEDGWPIPPKHEKITKLKPNTATADANYELKTYKRVVHLMDVKAHLLPVVLRAIEAGMPESVSINVVEHTEMMGNERFVPDRELLELKDQLTDLGGPLEKKTGKRR